MKRPELVAMTVWHDETVKDAEAIFDNAKDLEVDGWGLKDVGLPKEDLKKIIEKMKSTGKRVTLEILMEEENDVLDSAQFAIDCGITAAVGGNFLPSVCKLLSDANVEYYPFIGKGEGNPHRLGGTIEELVNEAVYACENGATGVCLPFYRYKGEPTLLIKAISEAIDKPVISAGSVNSKERFDEMAKYGISYLNIGTSFFESDFVENGTFNENVIQAMKWLKEME